MARPKFYTNGNTALKSKKRKDEWNVALYIRLSREDGDKIESDSVTNQKAMLSQFANTQSNFEAISIYADDGYTGTNYNRPQFQLMMKEIEKGTINCIIVKDLSRFGRNLVETSIYLEETLPNYKCRFISLLEDVDTHVDPQKITSILVQFKNLMNDQYCKDISNKVRQVKDYKRKAGELVCTTPPYGYIKDPNDHRRLIVDTNVAHIVKQIFELSISGTGCVKIAKKFNSLGILSPSMYKLSVGIYKKQGTNCSKLWRPAAVRVILDNMTYMGCLEQKKTTALNYKTKKRMVVDKDKRILVYNTHEPIITKDMYYEVQKRYTRCQRNSEKADRVYLFSGFLRCVDCKSAMLRNPTFQKGKQYVYYKCRTYSNKSREICSDSHSIRHEVLEEAVYYAVKSQIFTVANMQKVLDKINDLSIVDHNKTSYINDIRYKERVLEKKIERRSQLYEDFKDNILSREEYLDLKKSYSDDIDAFNKQLELLRKEQEELSNLHSNKMNWMNDFLKYKNINKLNRTLIQCLIDKIYIGKDKTITIDFIYQDKFNLVIDHIENTMNKEVRYHEEAK